MARSVLDAITPPRGSGISSTRSPRSTTTIPPPISSSRRAAFAMSAGSWPSTSRCATTLNELASPPRRETKLPSSPRTTHRPPGSRSVARTTSGGGSRRPFLRGSGVSTLRVMTLFSRRITGNRIDAPAPAPGGWRSNSSGRGSQVGRNRGRTYSPQSGAGNSATTRPSRTATSPRATTHSGVGSRRSVRVTMSARRPGPIPPISSSSPKYAAGLIVAI